MDQEITLMKTDITVVYDIALSNVLRLNYNLRPIDTYKNIKGELCEAYATTDSLMMHIDEYKRGRTYVNIRNYLEFSEQGEVELAEIAAW